MGKLVFSMNLAELQLQLVDLARQCSDPAALEQAARVLQQASRVNVTNNGFGNAQPVGLPSTDGSTMSREEFMKRLRG
jgi:hypothetical protein